MRSPFAAAWPALAWLRPSALVLGRHAQHPAPAWWSGPFVQLVDRGGDADGFARPAGGPQTPDIRKEQPTRHTPLPSSATVRIIDLTY